MNLRAFIPSFCDELQKIADVDPAFAGFMAWPNPPPALPPQLVVQLLEAPKVDYEEYRRRRRAMGGYYFL